MGIAFIGMGTKCEWEAPVGEIRTELCAAVDGWYKRASEICHAIPDEFQRMICLQELSAQNTAISVEKIKALNAYITCDASRWDLAIEGIQGILSLGLEGLASNYGVPLGSKSQSDIALPGEHAGGGQYVLAPDAHLVFDFGYGPHEATQIEGSFTIELLPDPAGGYEGAVTDVNVAFAVGEAAEEVHVTLEHDALPGWVELDASGEGTVAFPARVDNEMLGNPLMWVELPIESGDPEVELLITTHGMIDSAEIFPVETIGVTGDCNGDGVSDESELLAGAPDCNGDGVPDTCQLGGHDCNGNGQLDACDIADGTMSDENSDDFPDECSEELLFKQAESGPFVAEDEVAEGGCSCSAGDTPSPLWTLLPLGLVLRRRRRRRRRRLAEHGGAAPR